MDMKFNDKIQNKRILFIAPRYFGYEKYIISHLENLGAKVFFFEDNLHDFSFMLRGIYVVNKSIYRYIIQKKITKKIKKIESIDYLFVIKGEVICDELMATINNKYPNISKLLYLWDSVRNASSSLTIIKHFDKVLSFDFNDCKKYGWKYRPLFYIPELVKFQERKYDISFIGVLHSQRTQMVHLLNSSKDYNQLKKYIHLYNNRIGYYFNKYFLHNPIYEGLSDSDVKHFCLNIVETNSIYDNTVVLLDYTNPNQTGYTMRTIEGLGHECKLVTNNKFVLEADFYNNSNILYYENVEDLKIDEEFISSPYVKQSLDLMEYYSLDGWLDTIFD